MTSLARVLLVPDPFFPPAGSCRPSGRSAVRTSSCGCPFQRSKISAWRRCCAAVYHVTQGVPSIGTAPSYQEDPVRGEAAAYHRAAPLPAGSAPRSPGSSRFILFSSARAAARADEHGALRPARRPDHSPSRTGPAWTRNRSMVEASLAQRSTDQYRFCPNRDRRLPRGAGAGLRYWLTTDRRAVQRTAPVRPVDQVVEANRAFAVASPRGRAAEDRDPGRACRKLPGSAAGRSSYRPRHDLARCGRREEPSPRAATLSRSNPRMQSTSHITRRFARTSDNTPRHRGGLMDT